MRRTLERSEKNGSLGIYLGRRGFDTRMDYKNENIKTDISTGRMIFSPQTVNSFSSKYSEFMRLIQISPQKQLLEFMFHINLNISN